MSGIEPTEEQRQAAAALTGCRPWGYGAYCEHRRDETGQVPWDQCRWVPVARALADAEVRGAARGEAENQRLFAIADRALDKLRCLEVLVRDAERFPVGHPLNRVDAENLRRVLDGAR